MLSNYASVFSVILIVVCGLVNQSVGEKRSVRSLTLVSFITDLFRSNFEITFICVAIVRKKIVRETVL